MLIVFLIFLAAGRVLKIDVTKNRFFWCISWVKGTLQKIHSPDNFLLVLSKNPGFYGAIIKLKKLIGLVNEARTIIDVSFEKSSC